MKGYTGAVLIVVGCMVGLSGMAMAQGQPPIRFSIDFQGPSAMTSGGPFSAGDVLAPTPPAPAVAPPPLPPPTVVTPEPALGIVPGQAAGAEVDALSYGRDDVMGPVWFSVDEHAVSWGPMMPPDTFTEGPVGGGLEASADVFWSPPMPFPGPPPGPGPAGPNTGVFDGDGFASMAGTPRYRGLGLVEPNPPTPGALPDLGDNLDALTFEPPGGGAFPVYFSMDAAFPDTLEMPPANTGTAVANGFVGGDVVVSMAAGGPPALYAPAPVLGLDLAAGGGTNVVPDTDDLDALALLEDGDGVFTPGADILVFSVRRDSAVIGAPDALWNAPIEPGDILMDPVTASALTGLPQVSPFPAIAMPAEFLGLFTARWGVANPGGFPGGDELDALVPEPATLALLGLGAAALVARRRRNG